MNRYLLTGVTGIVGRHVLYELLLKALTTHRDYRLYVVVRSNASHSAYERLSNVLTHAYSPDYLELFSLTEMLSHIEIIEGDLSDEQFAFRIARQLDGPVCVIHSAATTNLENTDAAADENYRVNYQGTMGLLKAVAPKATQFSYISTAYSCGIHAGFIQDDYLALELTEHRNPYESIKAKTERDLAKRCAELKLTLQILRPGIVCGRLIDTPHFFTPSFNVFYEYAKFFHVASNDQALRIVCNKDTGLHIVPVDYVAKAIVKAIPTDIRQMNITSSSVFKMDDFIKQVCQFYGFSNYRFVDSVDDYKSKSERLYYRTVGKRFYQYMNSPPYEFDTQQLKGLMGAIVEPSVHNAFQDLLEFAQQHQFKAI